MKTQNNIHSLENYLSDIDINEKIIFFKYIGVIQEFIQGCLDNIFIKNKKYYKYILISGIKMLNKVFNLLLLYTNNVDLTQYHSSKALFYYIEFISQIGDEGNAFLKLNSTDAYLFILKKTVFEIDENHRKNFKQTDKSIQVNSLKDKYISIYNNIIINIINNFNISDNNDDNTELLKLISKKLFKISELLIQFDNIESNYECIDHFVNFILPYDNNLPYIECFIKKILKKNKDLSFEKIKKNINNDNVNNNYKNMNIQKFINFIIC
jgi:hypothetical protein